MSATLELERLAAAAGDLARARGGAPTGLPPLLVLTDPVRTPDPVLIAERTPRGAGLIYRAFGAGDARAVAGALAAVARRRGLLLLIGADEALAAECGADGVHLPERMLARARAIRGRHPLWRITGAAHGLAPLLEAGCLGLDGVLLSAVFPSRSPSAGRPLGPVRTTALVRLASAPVYALGGVNVSTVRRLKGSGVAGVAAVGTAVTGSP